MNENELLNEEEEEKELLDNLKTLIGLKNIYINFYFNDINNYFNAFQYIRDNLKFDWYKKSNTGKSIYFAIDKMRIILERNKRKIYNNRWSDTGYNLFKRTIDINKVDGIFIRIYVNNFEKFKEFIKSLNTLIQNVNIGVKNE